MKKEEFLRQLEYLLQDIPEEEKRDAIDYYRDYLEEAGPEREEEVLEGFGSPERVAAIIRSDMAGGMEEAGEFTDQGFTDQRFSSASYPAERTGSGETDGGHSGESQRAGAYQESRGNGAYQGGHGSGTYQENRGAGAYQESHSSDAYRQSGGGRGTYEKGSYANRRGSGGGSRPEKEGGGNHWWKYLLIGLGVLIIGPILLGISAGAVGSLIGLLFALAACLLVLAVLTLAALLGGAAMVVFGIIQLFPNFWVGLMFVGLGFLFAGIGCLLFFCSWLFYGKFLPWAVTSIIGLVKRMTGNDRGSTERNEKNEQPDGR